MKALNDIKESAEGRFDQVEINVSELQTKLSSGRFMEMAQKEGGPQQFHSITDEERDRFTKISDLNDLLVKKLGKLKKKMLHISE